MLHCVRDCFAVFVHFRDLLVVLEVQEEMELLELRVGKVRT